MFFYGFYRFIGAHWSQLDYTLIVSFNFTLISFLSRVISSEIQLLIFYNNENFIESKYKYFISKGKKVQNCKWIGGLSGLFSNLTWAPR